MKRVEYIPGGIVAAAPGGGDWVHQHFATGTEPLRVLAANGPPTVNYAGGAPPGARVRVELGYLRRGRSIDYWQEDPQIRAEFEATLEASGLESLMPPGKRLRTSRLMWPRKSPLPLFP